MRSKTSVSSLLAALLLVTFAVSACDSADSDTADTSRAAAASSTAETGKQDAGIVQSPKVIAYYFRTTGRCVSCRKIEAYSKEAIETGFANELKNGTLAFHSINVEEPQNRHFVEDYHLYTKSLVICDMENGKQRQWKNLTQVWQLIRNKSDFVKYVQDEINAYLKES